MMTVTLTGNRPLTVQALALEMSPGRGKRFNEIVRKLRDLIAAGTLSVRDPKTLMTLPSPESAAVDEAVLILDSYIVSTLAKTFDAKIILRRHGSGPVLWTLENAAAAIGRELGWHSGAVAALSEQLVAAANQGALIVRDPRTELPVRSQSVHTYYEVVRQADLNDWLNQIKAGYRLGSSMLTVRAKQQPKKALERQGDLILQAIKELSLNPLELEHGRRGQEWPLKTRLIDATGLTKKTFEKAMTELKARGKIRLIPPA